MAAKRFKAQVIVPNAPGADLVIFQGKTLHPTHDRALKEGIDAAVAEGLIVVKEVEAEQKVKREWVEKE